MIKVEVNTPNICIITTPRPQAAIVPLSNFVDIMLPLSNKLHLITGNDGDKTRRNNQIHCYSISYKTKRQIMARILNYIYLQLRISYSITKLVRNVDLWIFFMGEGLLLPILVLKLLGKPTILCLAASSPKVNEFSKDMHIVDKMTKFLEIISYALSNEIIIYSPNLIEEWNLEKYRVKILIAHEHFLDFNKLKIIKRFNDRDCMIGYVGRLSEEKGISNFIKSIPGILEKQSNISFLIAGEGQLRGSIEKFIREKNLDNINFIGWIPHDQLPNYLNQLKLIVLPSYTEGLPNIILESMACGTPILATPVGSVPDIIKDCETGFIMENNSPECIIKNIIRALEYPYVERIIKNASTLVEKEYTYDRAVEGYRIVLEKCMMWSNVQIHKKR